MRIGKRRISKKLVLIVVPVVLVLGVASGALAATGTFTDIAGNAHEQSIIKEAAQGVAGGYPDGTFRPDQPVTRGQMMTFLDRFNTGITCTQCHNDTTLIVSKQAQFGLSVHASGTTYLRGASAGCSACHGSEGPKARINAGVASNDAVKNVAVVNVSPMNCRTCHNIHTTNTSADFAVTGGDKPVKLDATGVTFDKGEGNLCVNCHQSRVPPTAAVAGMVTITSTHYGPHHGPEANLLLGNGGAGVTGNPSSHYTLTANACVTCHMGSADNHTFTPVVANCQSCHSGAKNFDVGGVQTAVKGMLDQIKPLLLAKGIIIADGTTVPGAYPEKLATAYWNYQLVLEDKSLGVHNSSYSKALLQASLDALK